MTQRGVHVTSILMLIVCCAFAGHASAQAPAPAVAGNKAPLTLEDLFSEQNVIDTDISPSGKMIAAAIRHKVTTTCSWCSISPRGKKTPVTRINKDAFGDQIDVRMGCVCVEDRRSVAVPVAQPHQRGRGLRPPVARQSAQARQSTVRSGSRRQEPPAHVQREQYDEALVGAFDTSDIASIAVERSHAHPGARWRLGRTQPLQGRRHHRPRQDRSRRRRTASSTGGSTSTARRSVRVEYSVGTLRYYRRLDDGKWKKYYSVRRSEMDGAARLLADRAPPTDPNKFYVLARPPGKDRFGVYLYDLPKENFGEPLIENATLRHRRTRSRRATASRWSTTATTCTCASASSPMRNRMSYMRGLRKYFDESANVNVIARRRTTTTTILLRSMARATPPAYYYYLVDEKKLELVGLQTGRVVKGRALPEATVVNYKTRDGLEQTGYLTYPPGAKNAKGLPLVLMPHGGPQARDRLEFDPWVQYIAARGYAVFQPNFRGSSGFGEAFEDKRKSRVGPQDAGRPHRWRQGTGRPGHRRCRSRCASSALHMAATRRWRERRSRPTSTSAPCRSRVSATSTSIVRWQEEEIRRRFGELSIRAARRSATRTRTRQLSARCHPSFTSNAIKIPILLIHGDDDERVPYSQSAKPCRRLLEKSGRKTQLLKLRERRARWLRRRHLEGDALDRSAQFLWDNLGKGYGVDDPPAKFIFEK